jgi:cobalt-zinc-cadmium efflux system outer membrane protein
MWSIITPPRAGLAGLVLAIALCTEVEGQIQTPPESTSLTLVSVLEAAKANSRLVRAAELRIDEAEGGLTQARVLLIDNPELMASRGRRSSEAGLGPSTPEFEIGLEQRVEIGGQRGKRIRLAGAEIAVAQHDFRETERAVTFAVTLAFHEGLAAQTLVEVAERQEALSQDLLDLAQRRLDAGVGTQLELNAAVIRFAEARRTSLIERRKMAEADLLLRRLSGLDPEGPLLLEGDLPRLTVPVVEEIFVSRAMTHRPDLGVAIHRVNAASEAKSLASAEGWPDITLDASFGREEGEDLFRAGLRLPLSLFNRNQGHRGATRAAYDREVELREDLRLEVEREVRTAVRSYQQAGATLLLYDADVLRAQQESLDLVQLAAEEGELSIADVLVVQREVLDGLRGYLTARLEVAHARARLLASVSLPQDTDLNGEIQ